MSPYCNQETSSIDDLGQIRIDSKLYQRDLITLVECNLSKNINKHPLTISTGKSFKPASAPTHIAIEQVATLTPILARIACTFIRFCNRKIDGLKKTNKQTKHECINITYTVMMIKFTCRSYRFLNLKTILEDHAPFKNRPKTNRL